MALPQAVLTFLATYDFTDKTIIPFNTHGGYGAGQMVAQIQAAVGDALVLPILSVAGGQETNGQLLAIEGPTKAAVAKEVTTWLQKKRSFGLKEVTNISDFPPFFIDLGIKSVQLRSVHKELTYFFAQIADIHCGFK